MELRKSFTEKDLAKYLVISLIFIVVFAIMSNINIYLESQGHGNDALNSIGMVFGILFANLSILLIVFLLFTILKIKRMFVLTKDSDYKKMFISLMSVFAVWMLIAVTVGILVACRVIDFNSLTLEIIMGIYIWVITIPFIIALVLVNKKVKSKHESVVQ